VAVEPTAPPNNLRPTISGQQSQANGRKKVIVMISEQMSTRISAQINREFYSAYFYLALSAQAETADLKGTAAWFMAKHAEEMTHALKMYHYLIDQDAPVQLSGISNPPADSNGVMAMFESTLAHEREVTAAINDLVDHALSEKDHATNIFLQWFVTEQIEEEATVKDILGRLRLFGDQGQALLLIDNELAAAAKAMGQNSTAGAGTSAA
jgi:ferritin